MPNRYEPNHRGLRELLQDRSLAGALKPYANVIEQRAKSGSPVESAESAAHHHRQPGKFRDSIHQEEYRGVSRHSIRVVADCEGAVPIEQRDHPLGKAAG